MAKSTTSLLAKPIHLILEIKKLASDPNYHGQVTGLYWDHWIAGKTEGQCASLIGDYIGDWLMNPNAGHFEIKCESLGEAYESFPRHQLIALPGYEMPKTGSTFIHLSLFSMDNFKSGYSVAIEGRFFMGEPDKGPFTDDE